jgi:acyl-ACP thioesterase
LSWVKLEFISHPKFTDEVKIQTWGKKQYKLYSLRDFLMFNDSDEVITREHLHGFYWIPNLLDQKF